MFHRFHDFGFNFGASCDSPGASGEPVFWDPPGNGKRVIGGELYTVYICIYLYTLLIL